MKPKIVGHRGAKNEKPENTLEAIKYALACGVDAIEIDVHLTADGGLVVMHDPDVSRTTNGTGDLKNMTRQDIKKLTTGNHEQIPFLEEVLAITTQVILFVEIKCLHAEPAVIAAISKAGRLQTCIIKAFNHRILARIKHLCPALQCACLLEGLPLHAYRMAQDVHAEFISLHRDTIDQDAVDECHIHGIKVCVWTAENEKDRTFFTEMGVDYIITGTPGVLCNAKK